MLYIRTDMNEQIATGHMMRCLSIADAAKCMGEETTFLVADDQAVELIYSRGHHFIVLGTRWDMLEDELPVLLQIIHQKKIKKMLVDSYCVTEKYLRALSDVVNITYIDDLNLFYYPVANLVCCMNYYKKFRYEDKYTETNLMLGPSYIPLRKEFATAQAKRISRQIERLLLLSGGTDTYGVLPRLLESLNCDVYKSIVVICGRYDTNYEKLCACYAQQKNVVIRRSVPDIEKYMLDADVAIAAGGTTLYELCALGVPTVSYSFADNQLDNVQQFSEDDLIEYAGDVRKIDVAQNIKKLIESPLYNWEMRQSRSQKMQELVDGKGAQRIAKVLVAS